MAGDAAGDSVLSIIGTVVGLLTFVYGILVGALVLGIQLRHASGDIKRFAKSVAFLRLEILRLPKLEEQNKSGNEGAAVGRGLTYVSMQPLTTRKLDPELLENTLELKTRGLHKDSWRLFVRTRNLAPLYFNHWPEDPESQIDWDGFVRFQDKLRWMWTQNDYKSDLADVQREYDAIYEHVNKSLEQSRLPRNQVASYDDQRENRRQDERRNSPVGTIYDLGRYVDDRRISGDDILESELLKLGQKMKEGKGGLSLGEPTETVKNINKELEELKDRAEKLKMKKKALEDLAAGYVEYASRS